MKPTFPDLARRIGLIADSADTSFSALVRVSGLRPGKDFKSADLAGVDFGPSDLSGYDFTNANLANANLRHVRNLEAAELAGANLEGAQLPEEKDPYAAVTKEELVSLVRRAAHQALTPALERFLISRSRAVSVKFARRTHFQGDLFEESSGSRFHVSEVHFALPASIGRTALNLWDTWHPRRREWMLGSISFGSMKSSPIWVSARDTKSAIIAPLTHRTRARSQLLKVVTEQPVAGPTARMLGDAFSHFFRSALEEVRMDQGRKYTYRQGPPSYLAGVQWRDRD